MQELFFQFITAYGLIGVFLTAIALNASVLLPLPFDIIFAIIAGLLIYNPVLLGIAAGFGAAIGEMTGYSIGYFGSKAIEKISRTQMGKIKEFKAKIENLGTVFIFIGALIPFPFDFVGISAGLIKFDWKKFFIAVLCGRTLRYILLATAIYYGMEAIKGFFTFMH